MPALDIFSRHLAQLIPAVGSAEFPAMLVAMLRELVPADDASVIHYPARNLPVIEYFEVPGESGGSSLDVFVKGPFLLDPYYLAATRDRQFGVFRLRDLSPSGFRDSEYYKTWYRNSGFQDECGFLIPLGRDGFVNIALGKTAARAAFSKRSGRSPCGPTMSTLSAAAPSARARSASTRAWSSKPA